MKTRTEAACHAASAEALMQAAWGGPLSDLEYIGALTGRDPIKPIPPLDASTFKPVGLDRQIALARREMGEARWAQLNAEWEV